MAMKKMIMKYFSFLMQVVICGQLHVCNRLDLPVEVKVIFEKGSHNHHRAIGQPGHVVPSYIMELANVQGIKFRCLGRNVPWGKEVFIAGEKIKENNLVKVTKLNYILELSRTSCSKLTTLIVKETSKISKVLFTKTLQFFLLTNC